MLNKARSNPIIFTYIFIVSVIILNRIPIDNFIKSLNLSLETSDSLENTIRNIVVIGICFWLIIKFEFIQFLKLDKFEIRNIIYFLPLVLYIFFLTNSTNFSEINYEVLYSTNTFIAFFEKLTSAVLEEIIFRGLVLSLILHKYVERKNGIFTSVLITSFIFGTLHIVNLDTQTELLTTEGVFKQIFYATCLGVLFSAMFLKSRNLYILVAGHFVLNISSMLDRFQINSIGHAVPIIKEKSTLEIIASLFAIFVLFGVAALIGIAILKTIDLKQLKSQMNLGMNG